MCVWEPAVPLPLMLSLAWLPSRSTSYSGYASPVEDCESSCQFSFVHVVEPVQTFERETLLDLVIYHSLDSVSIVFWWTGKWCWGIATDTKDDDLTQGLTFIQLVTSFQRPQPKRAHAFSKRRCSLEDHWPLADIIFHLFKEVGES